MFDELVAKDSPFKIHDHNLQKPLFEIFKVKVNHAPEIMTEVFEIFEHSYPLRNKLKSKF